MHFQLSARLLRVQYILHLIPMLLYPLLQLSQVCLLLSLCLSLKLTLTQALRSAIIALNISAVPSFHSISLQCQHSTQYLRSAITIP